MITLLLLLTAFALAALLTRFTLDTGHDSRTYHVKGNRGLAEGGQPLLGSRSLGHFTPTLRLTGFFRLRSMLWTQSFEASFAFTPIAVVVAFLCARRFLATLTPFSRALSHPWRNVLAFLLAVNPIATRCFFTHYADGLLVSILLSVFLLMLCFVSEDKVQSRRTRLRTALLIAALLVLLVNIKFTGLVFGGILGLTALAYGLRRGASRTTLLRLAGLGSVAAILGVALFGFFPYATNIVQHKNPVYPFYPAVVFGKEINQQRQKTILEEATDPVLLRRSYYERWWISLFSKKGKTWIAPKPLAPFSSWNPSSFQFGFGSFFSGSLLLCLTLAFFVRHRGAWVVLAGVMVSVLSTEASVTSRLTPQNWWLPILFLAFLLASEQKRSPLSRTQRIVVFVVVAFLLQISLQSARIRGKVSFVRSQVVRQAERQGGWFVVPDTNMEQWVASFFFRYYKSGLTNVRLPTLSECPEKAETRRPVYGLMLCRP